MDLEIGSNLYRNTNGTVEVEGVPQLAVSLRQPGPQIRLNFVVFNEVGRVIAKVVNSAFAYNEQRMYELDKTPTSLVIKQTDSGKVVLQMEVKGPDLVVISKGEFLSIKAHLLTISPVEWSVEERRMSKGDNDLQGGPVQIG